MQLKFADFEQYVDAVAGVEGCMRVIGPGKGEWSLDVLDTGELIAMLGHDGAPVLFRGVSRTGRYFAYVSLPGSDTAMQGQASGEDRFFWYAPDTEVHGFSRNVSRYLAIEMDTAAVVQRARETAGLVEEHLQRTRPVVIGREAVAALVAPITRAIAINRADPRVFEAPAVRRAFSGQLIHALLGGLASVAPDASRRLRGRPPVPRNEIIRNSLHHIDRTLRGEAVIGDLAVSAGASQRSLNRAFDEVFGMGPRQYYQLERMHVVRRALRAAGPGDTVTAICMHVGIWDIGRFAGLYRRTFGLHPSVELAAALSARRTAPPEPA